MAIVTVFLMALGFGTLPLFLVTSLLLVGSGGILSILYLSNKSLRVVTFIGVATSLTALVWFPNNMIHPEAK